MTPARKKNDDLEPLGEFPQDADPVAFDKLTADQEAYLNDQIGVEQVLSVVGPLTKWEKGHDDDGQPIAYITVATENAGNVRTLIRPPLSAADNEKLEEMRAAAQADLEQRRAAWYDLAAQHDAKAHEEAVAAAEAEADES